MVVVIVSVEEEVPSAEGIERGLKIIGKQARKRAQIFRMKAMLSEYTGATVLITKPFTGACVISSKNLERNHKSGPRSGTQCLCAPGKEYRGLTDR